MAESIRRAGEIGKIGYDREAFALVGEKTGLRLQDAYERYMKFPPAKRSLVLQKFARVWFAFRRPLPELLDEAKPDVLPNVRERAYYDWNPGYDAPGRKRPHLQLDDNHAVGSRW
jgi:hypothetical protein